MKRTQAPRFWKVGRKVKKFVVGPSPGPHAKKKCIPVGIILRDILKYAKTMREVKEILNKGIFRIDDRIIREYKFPAGLMDIISLQDEHYRILPNEHGLYLQKIEKKDSKFKLLRIVNKTSVRGGKIQLNFHDGKNMLVEKDDYKTNDVIVLNLEKSAIEKVLGFKKGSAVIITGGNNIGNIGIINDFIVRKSSRPNDVIVKVGNRKIPLPPNYVFVVGEDKPFITFGE